MRGFRTENAAGISLSDSGLSTSAQSSARRNRREEYVGSYASDELESRLEVTAWQGRLMLKTPRAEYTLEPVARDLFRAGPQLVRFRREGGRVTAALVSRGALAELPFARAMRAAHTPSDDAARQQPSHVRR